MAGMFNGDPDYSVLPEFGLDEKDTGDGDVKYPPQGSYRYIAQVTNLYANSNFGLRSLQDFKKISIVEAKGYCYGWHFYQAADADMVIASDETLFGHSAFRYVGWAARQWQWATMMGLRNFMEMVFTGRPFTAQEMKDCSFVTLEVYSVAPNCGGALPAIAAICASLSAVVKKLRSSSLPLKSGSGHWLLPR